MSNNKTTFIFCSKYLPCDANIATIAKLKNTIWAELKNGMSLFSSVSAFFSLFIMNFVACASKNGKTITITILSTKTETATVFITPANKNK
ncbi:Uncharacterised protein [Streptococcus pneumoniae]|nr:Uncharacterised protein [Streptococcus pneumoniae]